MWPFSRKTSIPPVDGTLMYSRWLRAQRPPFEWFAGLTQDEQRHLAELGDEYVLYTADTVAELPSVQVDGDVHAGMAPEASEAADRAAAQEIARAILSRRQSGGATTTAGFGDRKRAQQQAKREQQYAEASSIFGRSPDTSQDPDPVTRKRAVPTAVEIEGDR